MKKTFILLTATLALLLTAAACDENTAAPPAPDNPSGELSVSPPTVNAAAAAGTYAIGVISNVAWSATVDADWLSLNPSAGENNGTITLHVSENTAAPRTATITVTAGALSKTTTVVQTSPEAARP
jgi:outer membrane lipoprotein-sorting protein